MDPLTIALMGGSALGGLFNGIAANRTAQENLDFQKQNAADELKFAKAGRTDAYGNTSNFDDALNQWVTQLTPEQQKLVKGQEHEQLLSTTQDAAQNRNVRQNAYQRGIGANEDYNTARAGYQYDQPPSQASLMNDITNLITQSRGTGDRAEANLGARQNIRQAGNLPVIMTSNGNQAGFGSAGQRLAQTMLDARKESIGESESLQQAHQSKYLPALAQFNQTAMGGGNTPISFSSTPGDVASREDAMGQLVQNALKTGGTGIENAAKLQSGTAGSMFPGIGDITKLIAANRAGTAKVGDPGNYGGSPTGNSLLNPSTYGNRNYQQSDYGDFTF